MKLPPWRILLPGAASLLIVAAVFVLAFIPLLHITDLGKGMEFDQRMLSAHLYTIEPVEGSQKVHFVSDGTLGRVKDPSSDFWLGDFVLGPQETFWARPSRNAYTEFRLHSVEADGVVIEYEAKYTGGRPLEEAETVDHGLVRLSWRQGENPYRLPPGPEVGGRR